MVLLICSLISLILSCLLFQFWFWYKQRQFKDCYLPKCYPFIGCVHLFLNKNLFEGLRDLYQEHNSSYLLFVGPFPVYVTKEPEEIKIILNNAFQKTSFERIYFPVLGESLTIAPVGKWKKHRKIVARCFNQTIINSFVPIFYDSSLELIEVLKQNKFDNLFEVMCVYTQRTFDLTMLRIKTNNAEYELDRGRILHNEILYDYQNRLTNAFQHFNFPYSFTSAAKQHKKDFKEVRIFYQDVLREMEKEEELRKKEQTDQKFQGLLKTLKEMNLTKEEMLDEISTMSEAGRDTVGSLLAFTCGMLAMHKDVQEKVYEEVISVVGPTRDIEVTDLPDLKYTQMVLNESLRLFPPGIFVDRTMLTDLDIGTRNLDKGTDVLIFMYAVHRDERFYPNPLKFDPERFSPEEMAKRPACSFIPFSTGPRNCLGSRIAYTQAKILIANIVRQLYIDTDLQKVEDVKLKFKIVLKAENLNCVFSPRKSK